MKKADKKLSLDKLNKTAKRYDVKTLGNCHYCKYCNDWSAHVGLFRVDYN